MSHAHTKDGIDDDECLARFVIVNRWIRRQDNTIKQDAFLPFPNLELSVTKHTGLTQEELWKRGMRVAAQREKPLLGRADLTTGKARASDPSRIDAISAPLPDNEHHVHIVGWPEDKAAQKIIAMKMASASRFVAYPVVESS